MNKREIGAKKEQIAAQYLSENGYEILSTNFYTRTGELDLVARKNAYVIFVEVKYRTGIGNGHPLEAVTPGKQRRILQAARYYLYRNGYPEDTPCRFDVIGILGEEIIHVKGAFEG
ncbi:MAG: YraN family protein [Clostridiales bacterium]|nr:YraN family protein [Clostridiales bacterium]